MAQTGGLGNHSGSDSSLGPRDYIDDRTGREPSRVSPPPLKKHISSPPRVSSQSSPERKQHERTLQDAPPDLVAHITEQVLSSLKANGLAMPSEASSSFTSSGAAPPADGVPLRPVYTPPSPERSDEPMVQNITTRPEPVIDGNMDGAERDLSPRRSPENPSSPPKGDVKRPSPPMRTSTDGATTLEKCWQPLFDGDGNPTPRVGQFLRGLANHIIEDYEPQFSLVITPAKMLRFYAETRQPNEIYPWNAMFGGKLSTSRVSHLYRDLDCAHHFVQTANSEKPSIPALTPVGFERWMIQFIRAHPDLEFGRLNIAALNMPISNADNRKERFPKELSRRLLPARPNNEIRMDIEDAILQNEDLELTPQPSSSSDQSSNMAQQRHRASAPPPNTNLPAPPIADIPLHPTVSAPQFVDRDRQKSSDLSSESAVDDGPPNPSIERARKPYTAAPGGGKVFDDDPRPTRADSVPHRSNTMGAAPRPVVENPDDYAARVRQERRRSQQTSYSTYQNKRRSPSAGRANPYTRSDPDIPPFPGAYFDPHGVPPPPRSDVPMQKSYPKDDRPRRQPYDDPARFHPPASSQPPVPPTYDEDYYRRGPPPAAGPPPPPPPPPASSYPSYVPPPPRYG